MMPSDPYSDRLRLVVEPEDDPRSSDDEAPGLIGRLAAQQRHPEDMLEADEPDEAPEPTRHRRLLPIGLAAVALVAFAGVIWYAYHWGIGAIEPEELPVIRADSGPIKIRPEEPGGLEVPHQDKLVLNEIAPDPEKPQVERLLPPPEVPKPPLPEAAEQAQPSDADVADAAPDTAAPQDATAEADTPAADAPALQTAAGPDEKVEDQAATAESAPPPPATPTPTDAQVAAVPPGAYVVQVASMKSREAAEGEWARLRQAFPDLLGERDLVVQSVDLGAKGTFHRVQAGTFTDRAGAEALCTELKAKKQDCLVVRR